nr:exodeoxyribonuclease VII large subunit [Pyrinomonadaceae bacterium]
ARMQFRPQTGMSVRVRGKVTHYAPSGETQLTVTSMEPSGAGALAIAFEQIRSKLEREGLFDVSLKRPIPFFPRKIGIITSPNGAAYHDIIHVLSRRAASISSLLIPTRVQGEGSADEIRNAVETANTFNLTLPLAERMDVLIVGRGGGAAEDLWAFNDENLARALRASEIPVISAVGHEPDITISDLVADLRAATPSAAAELVAGREEDIVSGLRSMEVQLTRMLDYMMLEAKGGVRDLQQRLHAGFSETYAMAARRFANVNSRLTPATLTAKVASGETKLSAIVQRQITAERQFLTAKNEYVERQMAKLHALSPLNVLNRGFSVTQLADGTILRDAAQAKAGDNLKIRLANGKLNAEVLSAESN